METNKINDLELLEQAFNSLSDEELKDMINESDLITSEGLPINQYFKYINSSYKLFTQFTNEKVNINIEEFELLYNESIEETFNSIKQSKKFTFSFVSNCEETFEPYNTENVILNTAA